MVTLEKSDPYSQKGPPLPSYIIFRPQNTTSFPGGRESYPHFTEEKTVQRAKMTCPKSPERSGAEMPAQVYPVSVGPHRLLWEQTDNGRSPPARTYFFSSLLPASCPSGHLELSLNEHSLNTNIFWMIE